MRLKLGKGTKISGSEIILNFLETLMRA